MVSERMDRLLYRYDLMENEAERLGYETLFSCKTPQIGSLGVSNSTLLGVCMTEKGDNPSSARSFEEFEENVEEAALWVEWFDPPEGVGRDLYDGGDNA